MIYKSFLTRQRGSTAAGLISVGIVSVLLLCGAGTVPIENFSPQGPMQNDLNAGGHNVTNVASVTASTAVTTPKLATGSIAALPGTQIVCMGDSLTYGQYSTNPAVNSYPAVLGTLSFAQGATISNFGVSGALSSAAAGVYAASVHALRPTANGGAAGVPASYLLIWYGANDWNTGVSLATFEANISAVWASAKADGFKVVAFTVTDKASTLNESVRASYNDYIRSQLGVGYDILVDTENLFPNPYDTTLFYTDNLHLSNAGYGILARAVNGVLSSGGSVPTTVGTKTQLAIAGLMFTDAYRQPYADPNITDYLDGNQQAIWMNAHNSGIQGGYIFSNGGSSFWELAQASAANSYGALIQDGTNGRVPFSIAQGTDIVTMQYGVSMLSGRLSWGSTGVGNPEIILFTDGSNPYNDSGISVTTSGEEFYNGGAIGWSWNLGGFESTLATNQMMFLSGTGLLSTAAGFQDKTSGHASALVYFDASGNEKPVSLPTGVSLNASTGALTASYPVVLASGGGSTQLSGGVVSVAYGSISTSMTVIVTHAGINTANAGALFPIIVSGTGFTIKSANAADNDYVNWKIVSATP